jgi:hypothetical protein
MKPCSLLAAAVLIALSCAPARCGLPIPLVRRILFRERPAA